MTLFPRTILIRTDLEQKQSVSVNGMVFQIIPNRQNYESNGRETLPVIAQVVGAGDKVLLQQGDLIVLHHNMSTDEIWKTDDGQSIIPFDRWVMAKVTEDGWLKATKENIIANRVKKPFMSGEYILPDTAIEFYSDRVLTEEGKLLGIRKWGDYEVCWHWNGEVRRKIVLWEGDVVCELIQGRAIV